MIYSEKERVTQQDIDREIRASEEARLRSPHKSVHFTPSLIRTRPDYHDDDITEEDARIKY